MRDRGRALLILLPLLILLAGGAGAYLYLVPKRPADSAAPKQTYLLALPELAVNLADQDRPHYLTISLGFVIAGEDVESQVEERDAWIRDAVIAVMSQHTYRDLLSSEGKESLRDDLSAAASQVLSEQELEVTEVLFTTFIMD
jgi:flagellar FliL protein